MKYIYKDRKIEVKDWRVNQADFLRLLAFIHEVFKLAGKEIPVDVPVPKIKFTQFHFSTKVYANCLENSDTIYIPTDTAGKKLHATLAAAVITYYAKQINEPRIGSEILEDFEVRLTIAETALTSAAIIGGLLTAKTLFGSVL